MSDEYRVFLELEDGEFEITDEYISESRPLRKFYVCRFRGAIPAPIRGKSSSIVRRALQFCKERGEIRKTYSDANILKHKLKLFDDDFFQRNKADAIELADIACRLQIRNLYYLMREAAADMLAQKSEDYIYDLFKIHYDENKTTDLELKNMTRVVRDAAWALK